MRPVYLANYLINWINSLKKNYINCVIETEWYQFT